MIKEYAVDPKIFENWTNTRFILDYFGFSKGRVISKFPRKWLKFVHNSCKEDLKDVARKEMIERLARLKKEALIKFDREYHGELSWNQNVLNQHKERAFAAILVKDNIEKNEYCIPIDKLDEEHDKFRIERSCECLRDAEIIADHIAPILEFSSKIVIIDPYMGLVGKAHVSVLKAIFSRLENVYYKFNREVHYFCNDEIESEELFVGHLDNYIKEYIPSQTTVNFYRLLKETMHNRFILTELGGLSFGYGLVEDENSNKKFDDIFILDQKHYSKKWKDYFSNKSDPIISYTL